MSSHPSLCVCVDAQVEKQEVNKKELRVDLGVRKSKQTGSRKELKVDLGVRKSKQTVESSKLILDCARHLHLILHISSLLVDLADGNNSKPRSTRHSRGTRSSSRLQDNRRETSSGVLDLLPSLLIGCVNYRLSSYNSEF